MKQQPNDPSVYSPREIIDPEPIQDDGSDVRLELDIIKSTSRNEWPGFSTDGDGHEALDRILVDPKKFREQTRRRRN